MGWGWQGSAAPGLTDSDAYREVWELASGGLSARPLGETLREAVAVRDAAEQVMLRTAREMRSQRKTWEQIGDALGMTRQGAQRFIQRGAGQL